MKPRLRALVIVLGAASLSAGPVTFNSSPNLSMTEATLFSGSLGTFADTDQAQTVSAFSVAIDWGNATTSAGTIAGGSGAFTISGAHSYADSGTFIIGLRVNDIDGSLATTSGIATISDAPLTFSAVPSFGFAPGVLLTNLSLGTFSDANSFSTASEYLAFINWDDSIASAGTVSAAGGKFGVSGSHSYSVGGNFTVTGTVSDDGGSVAAFQSLGVIGVPEPGSMGLMVSGLAVASILWRVRLRRGVAKPATPPAPFAAAP